MLSFFACIFQSVAGRKERHLARKSERCGRVVTFCGACLQIYNVRRFSAISSLNQVYTRAKRFHRQARPFGAHHIPAAVLLPTSSLSHLQPGVYLEGSGQPQICETQEITAADTPTDVTRLILWHSREALPRQCWDRLGG